MPQMMRLGVISSVLALTLGCGAPGEEALAPQGNAQPGQTEGAAPATQPGASGSADAPAASSAAPTAPAAPAEPVMMLMDVPSGTELSLILETAVSSETSKPDEPVRARVAKPVVISGMTVIPEGAAVTGSVVAAERSGRVKGVANVAIRFNRVTVANTPYTINTSRIAREAEATKGSDAKKIGIGAGVGAAIGAIAGGGDGAAIGAGVGGAAGTGVVLATRGKEVSIPAGTTLRTTVQETVRINAPM
jgi:hypothetical protein